MVPELSNSVVAEACFAMVPNCESGFESDLGMVPKSRYRNQVARFSFVVLLFVPTQLEQEKK